jgi:predicted alpha/beta superfamily hydrolase
MNTLIKNGEKAAIVIGIDNGGSDRIAEYTPWSNPKYGGGNGKTYMKFIVETLKPYIDKQYRTLSDRENTAIGGSSLGGLESFYGAIEYQNIFSKGMIFSPSFWWNTNCFQQVIDAGKKANMRFYFLAGGNEEPDDDVITQVKKMENTLLSKGFDVNQIKTYFPDYGQHNEAFWSNEFAAAYQWLFQKTTVTEENISTSFELFPNPTNDSITIQHDFDVSNLMFQIININGQVVGNQLFKNKKERFDTSQLPKGNYKMVLIQAETKQILAQKGFVRN